MGAIVPRPVGAFESEKQTFQTAQLVNDTGVNRIDNRVIRLREYLKAHNSPMADSASRFVQDADSFGLDWKLVVAISGNESYFGWYIPENSFNGWGWGVWTGTSYGHNFQNWEEGITTVSEGIKHDYIDKGFITIDQIGQKYAADPAWSWKVKHFMEDIEAFVPYKKNEGLLAFSL